MNNSIQVLDLAAIAQLLQRRSQNADQFAGGSKLMDTDGDRWRTIAVNIQQESV
jgi:hypothetical protein